MTVVMNHGAGAGAGISGFAIPFSLHRETPAAGVQMDLLSSFPSHVMVAVSEDQ
jgi:hypothetical protein